MSEQAIEKEIQEKGLNAPRLTPDHIDSVIESENYHIFENTTLTVCCLTLKNGFTVTGESAAASPQNFDVEIGRKIARQNAREKIWALEGYLLKQKLFETPNTFIDRMKTELSDLVDKLSRLEKFTETDIFVKLDAKAQRLLIEQLDGMIDYKNALSQRLQHHG